MIRPRRMKRIELTVLERDVDNVIEYLGKRRVIHLSPNEEEPVETEEGFEGAGGGEAAASLAFSRIPPAKNAKPSGGDQKKGQSADATLERVRSAAAFLRVTLPEEPSDDAELPTAEDDAAERGIDARVDLLVQKEAALVAERRKVSDALSEAKAFSNLKAPFAELEQLSYLTLRVGRLDPRKNDELAASLADRAVVVPLGEGDRVLAAASRKGRFALDSELKKAGFIPLSIPEDFKGVPAELLSGLEERLVTSDASLAEMEADKVRLATELAPTLGRLTESYLMASTVETLKAELKATKSAYRLNGWVAAENVKSLVEELERIAEGRVAVRAYDPDEVEKVRSGREKVPVSLDHGAFVGGFERVVFSYGAPLYGTIDPTPFVAFSFTLLFGLMFGDVGQGLVLLLLGILVAENRVKFLSRFSRFSAPLVSVGLASMTVGFLDGAVFANEKLLIRPTRLITEFLTGQPMDRVLHLMPSKGSLDKLFLFFAFTVAVGVIINSVGLVINIVNQATLKKWKAALFDKTGVSGALFFWYALFMGTRIALGGQAAWFDALGLGLPACGLFFGPVIWRLASGKRPLLEHGLLVFFMEGFVEILESTSSYISNTVSFLRVGAFALSHAVLSFIVFTLSDMVASQAPGGAFFAFLVMVLGNSVIIVLEGMIVAIQVVRLQYYEFFSKFFTETGVEFSPFRFRREVKS